VHTTSEMHTSVSYDNRFFLKVYRKVDKGLNPDVEITRYLSEEIHYPHTTKYAGGIEWNLGSSFFQLAMMEMLEENHGDGHRYMLERIANYIERILARDRKVLSSYPKLGSLTRPVAFEELSDELKEFVGSNAAEMARLMGERTAEVHLTLARNIAREFAPEEFSLHYQRSLFSSFTSLVRETWQNIEKKNGELPAHLQDEIKTFGSKRETILTQLKRIYSKKFDVQKIRIHGNFGLSHILLTGKDIILHDFGGTPTKAYSERRLKRSPLRDVVAMIHSFYSVAYEGFLSTTHAQNEQIKSLLPFADFWAHYMANFFMRAYLEKVKSQNFIPDSEEDFEVMLETFQLENSLHFFNQELNHHPQKAVIPLRIIQAILE
jgi:maltose alpha-D-glucosyltransferase/alpha-amylase